MAGSKKSKRARTFRGTTPQEVEKRPPEVARNLTGGSDTLKPVWSFKHVYMEGPFSWTELPWKESKDVIEFLQDLETMTWAEIVRNKKKWHHTVNLEALSKDAREALEKLPDQALDKLVSLRLSSKARIFVNRVDHVGQILWWDPDHKVCPSKKRNT